MRTLFRFLTLLLCLELIVSPFAPNMSLIAQNAHAEDCPTGFTFDSILNRCLTKTETANVMNATMACGNDSQCYKENAQKAFQDKVNAGDAPERKEGGGLVSSVATIAAIAGPVTFAVAGMSNSKSQCQSPSFYAMIGGAAALFVGDTLANMQHKKRLAKIKEEWGKIVNPEEANGDKDKERSTSIEAQSQAFEMLAKAEDSLASAAKMKKTFFMIATLAYGVSAVISGMEIIKEHTLKAASLVVGPQQAAAVTAYTQHMVQNTCTQLAASFEKKKDSFYVHYTEGKKLNIKEEIQSHYNLKNSTDLVSFIMNKKEQEGSLDDAFSEYEAYKLAFKDLEPKDKTVFEVFKAASLTAFSNLSPIGSAHAVEQAQTEVATETASGSSANSQGVNTNAAKAYKEDKAKGINFLALGAGIGIGVAAGMTVGAKMITSTNRLIFSGVMAGMTLMMANHAGSQAEASTKRAELLRKMRDEFVSASGAIYSCKSEDRNDPAKPNCYCYTSENQRNTSRGNSQICQKLWAGINTKASSYTAANQSAKVCVNQNRQADTTCACKQTNTCMKVSLSGVKGLDLGTNNMLNGAIAPLNGIANGSIDAANLNGASLASQAAKLSAIGKELEKNKALDGVKKIKDKASLQIKKDLEKGAAGMSSNNMLGSSGSSGMPSNPGEAARMLDKEISEQAPTGVSGSDTIATGNEAAPEQPLEFGMTGDQLAAQEGQIAEVMKQDMDFGGNDINQGSTTNIFEVLSNRYQRSGMRRLFDEKGETKPETASKSDITQ
jgi:hypothetical protein